MSCETSPELYEVFVRNEMSQHLHKLEGKELGCWCAPYLYHGDVLVKIMKEMKDERERVQKRKNDEEEEEFFFYICKTDS